MRTRRLHPRTASLAGLLPTVAVWGFVSLLAASEAPAAPAAASYAGAELCAGCHSAEFEEWKSSKHAGAYSKSFVAAWERQGKDRECLACHTTGFQQDSQTFAFEGVSCESCHGAAQPGHPGDDRMALPKDSTVCMSCHRQTYLEWQLSGHGKADIRCFDCHAVHRQGLRYDQAEQQCGACHAQKLEDFAHATHHQQGLTCMTCHMPAPRTPGFGGTGAVGHSFSVGAETCAACHEEMVHTSHKIPALTEEVHQLTERADVHHAKALEDRVSELHLKMDRQRARDVKIAIALFLAGLTLGAWLGARRGPGGSRPGP